MAEKFHGSVSKNRQFFPPEKIRSQINLRVGHVFVSHFFEELGAQFYIPAGSELNLVWQTFAKQDIAIDDQSTTLHDSKYQSPLDAASPDNSNVYKTTVVGKKFGLFTPRLRGIDFEIIPIGQGLLLVPTANANTIPDLSTLIPDTNGSYSWARRQKNPHALATKYNSLCDETARGLASSGIEPRLFIPETNTIFGNNVREVVIADLTQRITKRITRLRQ